MKKKQKTKPIFFFVIELHEKCKYDEKKDV